MQEHEIQIEIQKDSSISISDQIAHSISNLIVKNELKTGEKLPAERDLASQLEISRGTVKRAYAKLSDSGAIEMLGGSGSYVLTNDDHLDKTRKQEAAEIIVAMFARLDSMGFSEQETLSLINLHLSTKNTIKNFTIMVLSNNHEILIELEKQLNYLSSTALFSFTLTFMTLDPIAKNPNPIDFLWSYDLIIATSIDYNSILNLVPKFSYKILEATISPKAITIERLRACGSETRFRTIYRTQKFKNMMTDTLLSLGFLPDNIIPTHELDYLPNSHFINDIDVILNFNESPLYVNPYFKRLNQDFVKNGGKIIHFEYEINREAYTEIESKIRSLLSSEAGGIWNDTTLD